MTTNTPLNELQPRLTALTEGVSGSAIKAQQALSTFLFSASQAQFGFSRGVAEDFTEIFKTNPTANPATAFHTLVTRWHDRSEQAIAEFRPIGDELRNSLYDSVEKPLEKASEVASEAVAKVAETVKPASPAGMAKARQQS